MPVKTHSRNKMLCKIADLIVEIPATEGLALRLGSYETKENKAPDIVICEDRYASQEQSGIKDFEAHVYMESGWHFYAGLLKFNGMMLHASAVALDGKAYLFSGPSGMGKSTHTRLWEELFPEAKVFNDDKPAIRCVDGAWYAYGTPWSGKHGININMKTALAGICFLRRGEANSIRRLSKFEAASAVISQTMKRFMTARPLDAMLELVNRLVEDVPVFELIATKDADAARLSYKTMRAEV